MRFNLLHLRELAHCGEIGLAQILRQFPGQRHVHFILEQFRERIGAGHITAHEGARLETGRHQ